MTYNNERNYQAPNYFPQLDEVIRLLGKIDKKLVVVIRKLEGADDANYDRQNQRQEVQRYMPEYEVKAPSPSE